jgi:transitional endoplasmic reticulum ATPase
MKHFRLAMENVRPTITEELLDYYERVEEDLMGGSPPATRERRREGQIGFQ